MTTESALVEAKSTCDGLHKLIRRISAAAADIDKGGSSSYEILALLASANTCVINLSTQLSILETGEPANSNILPLKRKDSTGQQKPDNTAAVAK